MIGIGTPRSQSKIPRPKVPSSCCLDAISEPGMNLEAPQFVPSEESTFHDCLLAIGPVGGRWKTSGNRDPSPIASTRRSRLTSGSGISEPVAAATDSSVKCRCGRGRRPRHRARAERGTIDRVVPIPRAFFKKRPSDAEHGARDNWRIGLIPISARGGHGTRNRLFAFRRLSYARL